ncbi:MAG: alanine--tRNA ligase [Lachnospiraceae bacterium]|nr:alanine--tRNA ligase [Lachnospiraceae bacterium]
MKTFTSKELRKNWIEFYEKRGHVNVGAVSLVSDGSTGVMFNVAGMQPLMPYLLGQKHPLGTRLCNVQGCVRTNDIDSVGDKSHGTFFEMMGSWSLGDYFKKERCQWSYELLTEVFGFDADHLAATVFAGDENAPRDEESANYRIESGFKPENIYYLPKEDNWWGLEYGPCGPDSEMFYVDDRQPCGPDCKPGCHCGKFTEVGNDVFMQYEKHKDGHLTPLSQKNVDTGWGLDRILAFLNGLDDVYMTDLHASSIAEIEKASGIKYGADEKTTRSMRIVADHIRTAVMLTGDAARLVPSNAGAGYVLRRLIRRAVRHGRVLGLKKDDFLKVATVYIDVVYNEAYPLLSENKQFVLKELDKEIVRFESTLENGMKEFVKILDDTKANGGSFIDGNNAFYLYDTFGFPLELTVEMAEENGLKVDEDGFKTAMDAQKQKARENKSFSAKLSTDNDVFASLDKNVTTEFVGYDNLECEAKILALSDGESVVNELCQDTEGTIITDKTPFYATMGGQVGDKGYIKSGNHVFEVSQTVKLNEGRVAHVGRVISGSFKVNDNVKMEVNSILRSSTCQNHSATHLLQAALREVLGSDVHQQGSYQDPERTRFDFSYGEAMTADQIKRVQDIVNEKISADLLVSTDVMSIDEAKKSGAMALFGEKYGDTVRVVSMGDFSKELCGGTHVSHTGLIRAFKIVSESGIAAGVRRIEAITGDNVLKYYSDVEARLDEASSAAKTTPADLVRKIESMQKQIRELNSELESLKAKAARESLGDVTENVVDIKGVKLLATKLSGVDMNGLRDLGDQMKTKLGEGVVLLISENDGKVNMVAMATDGAVKMGAHSGNIIKALAPLVEGGGGGKPAMAQAGGKNPAGIDKAIAEAQSVLEGMIK